MNKLTLGFVLVSFMAVGCKKSDDQPAKKGNADTAPVVVPNGETVGVPTTSTTTVNTEGEGGNPVKVADAMQELLPKLVEGRKLTLVDAKLAKSAGVLRLYRSGDSARLIFESNFKYSYAVNDDVDYSLPCTTTATLKFADEGGKLGFASVSIDAGQNYPECRAELVKNQSAAVLSRFAALKISSIADDAGGQMLRIVLDGAEKDMRLSSAAAANDTTGFLVPLPKLFVSDVL